MGYFSVRSPSHPHHPDWDFDETQYIGLFHPKNKLVSVKFSKFENFPKYAPPEKGPKFFDFGYNFF